MHKRIKYYSTNLRSPEVSFRAALLKGLAPDGGLYMPSEIPVADRSEIDSFRQMEYHEIAYSILRHWVADEIEESVLMEICMDAYDFEIPIEDAGEGCHILRLDQGPTASFKDFAARMMGRMMQFFLADEKKNVNILTATSGDTGGAVASAFHGLNNIEVIILYPNDEITSLQRKQMTTLRGNVKAIAVNGKFDDCQHLVRRAFTDPLLSHIALSSANSINIGRLLPQSVYYFYAWSRLSGISGVPVVFSVPSGNFGNLTGGLIARKMGMPSDLFIISTNANDEVPVYLKTGLYRKISPSLHCISSAMNVGHPGNLPRIISLYGGVMDQDGKVSREPDIDRMRRELFAVSISDEETRNIIRNCFHQSGIVLEPHGAVAWAGVQEYIRICPPEKSGKNLFVVLETAHPAKFAGEMENLTGTVPSLPPRLKKIFTEKEEIIMLDNKYDIFRDFILKNNN